MLRRKLNAKVKEGQIRPEGKEPYMATVIKFKAEDEINLLKKQLEEKDSLIKNQEDRIYELDYVNNSLDEIKEYFGKRWLFRDYTDEKLKEIASTREAWKIWGDKFYNKRKDEKEREIGRFMRNCYVMWSNTHDYKSRYYYSLYKKDFEGFGCCSYKGC